MAPMKMSWHTAGNQLASEWLESEATESYNPAWMQSSYPSEASAQRSNSNQFASLSPFGNTRFRERPFRQRNIASQT